MKNQKKVLPKRMWVVMLAQKWSQLQGSNGLTLEFLVSPDSPIAFLPLFATKEAAVKHAGGDDSQVREVEISLRNTK